MAPVSSTQPWALSSSSCRLARAVVLALCIIAVTLCAYLVRQNQALPGSIWPALVGLILFTATMTRLHYITLTERVIVWRLCKALGIALLEAVVFVGLLFFILLNTLGA
ncbi:hypothetical protein [Pseudaeromonas sharmana]